MIANIVIALVLAVIIVAFCSSIGQWASSRGRQDNTDFWISQSLDCPVCGAAYMQGALQNQFSILGDFDSARVFQCDSCGETSVFASSDGVVECLGVESQQRRCVSCGEQFYGKPDTECPTCSEAKSGLSL